MVPRGDRCPLVVFGPKHLGALDLLPFQGFARRSRIQVFRLSEFMAGSPLALSYPEPFRVTGPLPSLVLRTEDMWQKYNQCLEVGGSLNQGFPFSPL